MIKPNMVQVPRAWLKRLIALAENLDRKTSDKTDPVLDAMRMRQDVSLLIGFISSAKSDILK